MFIQIVPEFYRYDAISQHAMHIQRMLTELGIDSKICAQRIVPEGLSGIWDVKTCLPGVKSRDVILFHFSIFTSLLSELVSLPGRKVMIYHNITPAWFFEGISRKTAEACSRGRKQLTEAVTVFDLALGVSHFNKQELKAAGYAKIDILPLVVETNVKDTQNIRSLYYLSEKITLLHVGKWAPNKKIEDLVKVFYWLHRFKPESRMVLVGRNWEWENYTASVIEFIHRLNLRNAIRIIPYITPTDLAALYRASDVYLSMSEHEGFCVPLIEAMASRCPVIAYAAGAVPETVQNAGILYEEKRFHEVAEGIVTLLNDDTLLEEFKKRGASRASQFTYESVFEQIKQLLPLILEEMRN